MNTLRIRTFPPLFGQSSKGKSKRWEIRAVEAHPDSYIETTHGYTDGKMQTTAKKVKPKNVGKKNETSPFEQACLEAQSSWKRKIDKQYTADISTLEAPVELELPMLAHEYGKRKHNVDYENGVYIQPKLNGVRNLAKKMTDTTMRHSSRGGKIFSTLNHLNSCLLDRMNIGDMMDGEIFNPLLTFQEIVAILKKESEDRGRHQLHYHVYDLPHATMTFEDRAFWLESLGLTLGDDFCVKVVPTMKVYSEQEVFDQHAIWTDMGYEGTMIRNAKGLYKFKHRSVDLQKLKDFMDEEFRIIGGKQGTGKAEGQCIFRCITSEGKEFDVRCVGSNEVREEQWRNLPSYISKMLTVKFQAWSDDRIPIFPVGLSIRDGENNNGIFIPDM